MRQIRRGMTIMESLVALTILGIAAVVAAQLATWTLAERARTLARQAATDAAADVMESARARPWNDLTPEWAAARRLPQHLTARMPDGTLAVRVEPEPNRPHVKRVTVTVQWNRMPDVPPQAVSLVALFAERAGGGP
jgi:prepilin-type N-terminal cleavage/methylation domain-containing protein